MMRAFTLIELLIVMSIIAVLAGMAMPVLGIARREAQRTNTQVLLVKTDVALKRFKFDIGVYPYQAHSTAGLNFDLVDNRLAYHLAHEMTDSELATLQADTNRAKAAYDSAPHRFLETTAQLVAVFTGQGSVCRANAAQMLNRMGRERAGLMINAGHVALHGVDANSGVALLSPGGTTKGWGSDYLAGEIEAKRIQGDALIDLHQTPLLYVCPVICGISGANTAPDYNAGYHVYRRVVETDFGMQPVGRTAVTTLASDIRTTAKQEYILDFELWSAGADRVVVPNRGDPANRDNLPAASYNKGMAP